MFTYVVIEVNVMKLLCRQLCQLLNAEDIFKSFSRIIVDEQDVGFACKMVQTLNTILLTSTELFNLRNQLKNLKTQVRIEYNTPNLHRAVQPEESTQKP